MQVTIEGLCRGSGKVFVKATVKSAQDGHRAILFCATKDGTDVPCGLYSDGRKDGGLSYVAVIPKLAVPVVLSFCELDASGKRIGQPVTKTIDPAAAKWRSRLAYRLDADLASEIRDFDEGFVHERTTIHIERVILWEGSFKVSGAVKVPCDEDIDIAFRCFTPDLRPVDARFVVMHEKTRALWGGRGPSERTVEFAVDLPNQECDYLITAAVSGRPDLAGFTVFEWPECLRMAEEWFQGHIDAEGDERYPRWREEHRASKADLLVQAQADFADGPVFSVVVPLYKTPVELFDEMVLSVVEQSYGAWELLLVNASPDDARLQERIDQAVSADARIREVRLVENEGISLNTRAGIEAAEGDFVVFLDHDDTIEPDALFEYVLAITDERGADLLYCDEDRLMPDGRCERPIFKPDFSLDLLRAGNYICHLLCIRKGLLDAMVLPDASVDGAQDHDMTFKAFELGARMRHVPRVLYHWRMAEGSTALDPSAKPYAAQAGIRVVREHLDRMGAQAEVEHAELPFTYDVVYRPSQPLPKVSIIVPTKDEAATLVRCVESVEEKTDYEEREIVLVENNSVEEETFRAYERLQERYDDVRMVRWSGEFNFSKIVNFGAREAQGELLLFLNNDTEAISVDWLRRMAGICCREEVGAVGARLWYPDDTVQHGGIALIGGVAGHLQWGAPRGYAGYVGTPQKMQDLSAVTGACLMMRRDVFEELGGFDEDLAVAFNDVDLCLRARERGYLVVYDPKVELYHHESLTRGYEDDPGKQKRFMREEALMKGRWARYYVDGDPYYNKNLSQFDGFYRLGA